jgi:hypothetical protein
LRHLEVAVLLPVNRPNVPESPLVRRYRCGISLWIGIGLLVVASITALKGHYVPCGVLLTGGAHFVNHALGLPTLMGTLSSWLPSPEGIEPATDTDDRAAATEDRPAR